MRQLLLLTGLLIFAGLNIVSARAEEPFPIAVIDVVRIMSDSKAAKSIEAQREKMRNSFLTEISDVEQALRKEEQELSKDGPKLSQEEYAKRRLSYEEKLIAMRKDTQEKKRLMEEASGAALNSLREQLYLVVEEIADEEGYKLVISNKDVITGEKSLDITEEALRRLNQRLDRIVLQSETQKQDR